MRRPALAPDCARMGLAQGSHLLAHGLQRVAAITQRSATAQVQQQKAAVLAELAAWLASLPAEWGRHDCNNATPELVCLFLELAGAMTQKPSCMLQ